MTREKMAALAPTRQSPFAPTAESPGVVPSGSAGWEGTKLPCLAEDEILDYREGRTSEAERARIHEHLDVCETCAELVNIVLREFGTAHGEASASTFPWGKTFSPGSVLAERYRIVRFVGQGGMGEVYEAFDRMLGTRVALKTVVSTACDNPRAARKLFDEVRNAQRVTHAHVCRINELHVHQGSDQGQPPVHFLTMEFIDGERLGTYLRERGTGMPLSDAHTVARQLLEGLRAAHTKSVVHLDFKGDNIMLRRGGGGLDAVIMDFGLSRAVDADARLHTSERQQVAGTLLYMAPEQLECRAGVGPPADVYAFGVVLYELLTGRRPFEGASLSAILLKQLRERPAAPSSLAPHVSRELDAFVLKCLSPDSSARYADADAALAAFVEIKEWQALNRSGFRRRAFVFSLLGAAAMAAYGVSRVLSSGAPATSSPVADVVGGPVAAPLPTSLTAPTPSAPPGAAPAEGTAPSMPRGPASPSVDASPSEQKRPAKRQRTPRRLETVANLPRAAPSPPQPESLKGEPAEPVATNSESVASGASSRSSLPASGQRRPKLPGAPVRFLEPTEMRPSEGSPQNVPR